MRRGALAAAIAMIVVGGCSSASAPGPQRSGAAGPASFWTRSRLLDAQPLRGGRELVPAPGQTPDSHTTQLALRVGALFVRAGSTDHFCTASVVDSPAKDLLITAAHCINGGDGDGYTQDIVFIPDYRDGGAGKG